MFEIVNTCGRAIAAGAVVVALAACGSEVNVEVAATGVGGGSSSSSTSNGGAGMASASSSSSGGGGSLPAPTCAKGEAAIVAALNWPNVTVAFHHEGTWNPTAYQASGVDVLTTYVDVYDRLGVFWSKLVMDFPKSQFATTADGTSFDFHEVNDWSPKTWSPLVTVGRSLLLGNTGEGSSLAYFDPDAFDWHPYPDLAPFELTSAVVREAAGTVLGVGYGPQLELCDTEIFWVDGGSWTSPHCREDVKVFTGNEIPVDPPRAVALPNGDVVVVYYESYITIAATRLHEGVWSAPDSINLPQQSLNFGVTATPTGDVIVGLSDLPNAVSALRYVPGVGWGEPILIDSMVHSPSPISAAPGICGDDALIAYVAGGIDGEVRVARVRGKATETSTVHWFTEEVPNAISITTRPSL